MLQAEICIDLYSFLFIYFLATATPDSLFRTATQITFKVLKERRLYSDR